MHKNNIVGGRLINISSTKLFPENEQPADDFNTTLPSQIDVKPEYIMEWNQASRSERLKNIKYFELALVYLKCSKSWHNISKALNNNKFRYSLDGGLTYSTIILEDGNYEMYDIIEEVSEQIENLSHVNSEGEHILTIVPHYPTLKTKLKVAKVNGIEPEDVIIDFSISDFGKLLGFTKTQYTGSKAYKSESKIDITPIKEILVHCDVVNGSYYNNDKAQIIYRFNPCTGSNGVIEFHVDNPLYLPVIGERIDSIKMKLTDQLGRRIIFNDQDVSYMLHIRKNIN